MSGQQTRGIEHSATSDQNGIEKSAVGKGSIPDRDCEDCEGLGTQDDIDVLTNKAYLWTCPKCKGTGKVVK